MKNQNDVTYGRISSYGTINPQEAPPMGVVPVDDGETLTAMLIESTEYAGKALAMAYQISRHVFGISLPENEEEYGARSMRDAVAHQDDILKTLCEELGEIVRRLGV